MISCGVARRTSRSMFDQRSKVVFDVYDEAAPPSLQTRTSCRRCIYNLGPVSRQSARFCPHAAALSSGGAFGGSCRMRSGQGRTNALAAPPLGGRKKFEPPRPVQLGSLKSENEGQDPGVRLVPAGGCGWGRPLAEQEDEDDDEREYVRERYDFSRDVRETELRPKPREPPKKEKPANRPSAWDLGGPSRSAWGAPGAPTTSKAQPPKVVIADRGGISQNERSKPTLLKAPGGGGSTPVVLSSKPLRGPSWADEEIYPVEDDRGRAMTTGAISSKPVRSSSPNSDGEPVAAARSGEALSQEEMRRRVQQRQVERQAEEEDRRREQFAKAQEKLRQLESKAEERRQKELEEKKRLLDERRRRMEELRNPNRPGVWDTPGANQRDEDQEPRTDAAESQAPASSEDAPRREIRRSMPPPPPEEAPPPPQTRPPPPSEAAPPPNRSQEHQQKNLRQLQLLQHEKDQQQQHADEQMARALQDELSRDALRPAPPSLVGESVWGNQDDAVVAGREPNVASFPTLDKDLAPMKKKDRKQGAGVGGAQDAAPGAPDRPRGAAWGGPGDRPGERGDHRGGRGSNGPVGASRTAPTGTFNVLDLAKPAKKKGRGQREGGQDLLGSGPASSSALGSHASMQDSAHHRDEDDGYQPRSSNARRDRGARNRKYSDDEDYRRDAVQPGGRGDDVRDVEDDDEHASYPRLLFC
eukprot:TRINITY_DN3129_c0_g1_i3.p1 TRINITY_DN3129_c0_g1~~TRINITY_DN3129_c0_g1_i3.p1  ORF type:complete len:698 (+),score=123.30 TRINITY_DN3129_c0_g1_i3:688-2781(+)